MSGIWALSRLHEVKSQPGEAASCKRDVTLSRRGITGAIGSAADMLGSSRSAYAGLMYGAFGGPAAGASRGSADSLIMAEASLL